MRNIILRDPFGMTWPRWFEDEEPQQRGLKVHETDKNIVAEAVVAGIPAEMIDVHIEDGVLTIKAQSNQEEKSKGEYQATTRSYYYTTALSGGAWDKAKANIKDGVVIITIPKAEAARPRKITVNAEK